MRPGDFSPGNFHVSQHIAYTNLEGFNEAGGFLPRKRGGGNWSSRSRTRWSFNEAGGFLPRKHGPSPPPPPDPTASMRPGDFSPGNPQRRALRAQRRYHERRFNEAGGFLPRKPPETRRLATTLAFPMGFNEAGGFLPRKHVIISIYNAIADAMLQ